MAVGRGRISGDLRGVGWSGNENNTVEYGCIFWRLGLLGGKHCLELLGESDGFADTPEISLHVRTALFICDLGKCQECIINFECLSRILTLHNVVSNFLKGAREYDERIFTDDKVFGPCSRTSFRMHMYTNPPLHERVDICTHNNSILS